MHRRLFQFHIAAVLVIASTAAATPPAARAAAGPTCYVDKDATSGLNDGNNWDDAYTDLQSALTDTNCTHIWVAEGTYTPGSSRSDSFIIPPGVKVYGGFDGTEGAFGERDWVAHYTALSGEIGSLATATDNSYNVVTMNGTSGTPITDATVLDGFAILWGYYESVGAGAGLYCYGEGSGNQCSPTLNHLQFQNNYATFGGAIYLDGRSSGVSSPELTDVGFLQNTAEDDGGAIFADGYDGVSSPTLIDSAFIDNHAYDGGAMYNDGGGSGNSSPTLANVTFYSNDADNNGGAMLNYGYGGTSSPTLLNATFKGNTAGHLGGALFNTDGSGGASVPILKNVILWDDTADDGGDEISNDGTASPDISYSVVAGGCASTGASCGSGNLDTNPMLGPLWPNGGSTPTLALQSGSSAVDAGHWLTCSGPLVSAHDQRGVLRYQGPECDIGAFEVSQAPTDIEGDGITDPAKYVSSAGAVYYFLSSEGGWGSKFIGTDGDYILDSDFDGDGKTDPGKYVAAAGAVWYLGSADNAWHGVYVGSDGQYVPASDFDGDRRADPAKYVAAAGALWYRGSADGTWYGAYIGSLDGGVYVPGSDFDGDGKTDAAHTDGSGNVWYLGSADSTLHGIYIGADGPYVPRSDFDGDGTTDAAKFVTDTLWYLPSGGGGLTNKTLGSDVDLVVPGSDFDGDAKADPAKFVSSAGAIWYQQSWDSYNWAGVYMGGDTYDIVN